MSRIILALFLLVALVIIEIEAQKCKTYRTVCYPKRGCRTTCVRRARRDASEGAQIAQERSLEVENARFEEDSSDEEGKREVDDLDEEFEARMMDDVLEEESRDAVDENEFE